MELIKPIIHNDHFVEKNSQRILQLVEQSQIVIIVSLNLEQIKNLCNRVIVMDKSKILKDGNPEETLGFYNDIVIHPSNKKK